MIDYSRELNKAQFEAASTVDGPVLVIAGAGSGKTRTIVYRLAYLVESGIPASSILLLTFTRKAAKEMLSRAAALLGKRSMPELYDLGGGINQDTERFSRGVDISGAHGGTFHSFAYSILRIFRPEGYPEGVSVMDSHDIISALQHCREAAGIGKGEKSFPKNQTAHGFLSKARNKEKPLEDILRQEAWHLMPHCDALQELGKAYAVFKREKGLLDYDDLLFELDHALARRPAVLDWCRARHKYIMVDEYQDTNPVQARIARRLAGSAAGGDLELGNDASDGNGKETAKVKQVSDGGADAEINGQGRPVADGQYCRQKTATSGQGSCNIMAVGDDAQSIYAFRGADVRNILRFPDYYPSARIVRLEENYRSTKFVLDLANAVMDRAGEGFAKHLYTMREGGLKPNVIRPLSDLTQSNLVVARVAELLRTYPAGEIAVLFRAGFHSYHIELNLNKMGIRFRKYGGIKYTEAAHVKDVLSYARLCLNPLDYTAFARVAELTKGVGAKTCLKIYQLTAAGDSEKLNKALARFDDLKADLLFLDTLRAETCAPDRLLSRIIDHYQPKLEEKYPDDYPRRLQGLEEIVQIASGYSELDLLVADLSLNEPEHEEYEEEGIVLSTVHSAKGLEWSAVILIDLVEERFPSRHALSRAEDYEEERRLMYVACTRAKDSLDLFVPSSLYDRSAGGTIPATPSPFVRELDPSLYTEWQESYTGGLVEKNKIPSARGLGNAWNGPELRAKNAPPPAGKRAGEDYDPFPPDDAPQDHKPSRPALGRGLSGNTRDTTHDDAPDPAPRPRSLPGECGYCTHRIFGRGKIVQHIPPDKCKVNFPGFGLKVIMKVYLTMED